ncbi:MAG TPA: zf-TFIIB domain-containing protein [Leptospiraceae bacterium]|nr:zf-TFIIB domain-containing protein [Leptospiraceae bacterium]
MKCPRCNQTLEKVKTEYGMVAMCQSCFGHFLLEKNILQYIPMDKWNMTLNHAKNQTGKEGIHCSSCKSLMDTHNLPEEFNSIQIDRCVNCKVIWFDKDKIEDLKLGKVSELEQISKLNNENLDHLGKGLLYETKLKQKEKELERNRAISVSSNSDNNFDIVDVIEIITDGLDLLD